jgi:hypothetical protein
MPRAFAVASCLNLTRIASSAIDGDGLYVFPVMAKSTQISTIAVYEGGTIGMKKFNSCL